MYYNSFEDSFFITNRQNLKLLEYDNNIPQKFKRRLVRRFHENLLMGYAGPVEFTYGYTDEELPGKKIHAIAILRLPDQFNRSLGFKIVRGRLMRACGIAVVKIKEDGKFREAYAPSDRKPYDPKTKFISYEDL